MLNFIVNLIVIWLLFFVWGCFVFDKDEKFFLKNLMINDFLGVRVYFFGKNGEFMWY